MLVSGCSAGDEAEPTSSSPTSSASSAEESPGQESQPSEPVAPIGVSPGGITTRVDVPAESTEREYYEACHAAKLWMEGREGDRQSLIEPYLATIQAPGPGGEGSWNTPWDQLSVARQAAVIVAVQAAADDGCG